MADFIHKALSNLNKKGDGDMIDRLSATTTVTMLSVAVVVVSAKQYVGHPIQCWVPAQLTDAMTKYAESYCYVQNTYFLPVNVSMEGKKRDGIIQYYQWVPFILALQAFMFYTPRLFWRAISSVSGVNFNAMLTMACNCLISQTREQSYRNLADYVHWALDLHRAARLRASSANCLGRFNQLHLIIVFLLSKMLYIANAIGQIFLLDVILQTRDPLYGINMVRSLLNGTEWKQSGAFPLSTFCDFEIHIPGNVNRYSVQCVLMINAFNEKLFIFLWFWTMLVAVASVFSLIVWSFTTTMPGIRRRFVRRLLPSLPHDKNHPSSKTMLKFVDSYLGMDGVFLFRSINDRVGAVVASKAITYLWNDFVQWNEPRSNAAQSSNVNNDRARLGDRKQCRP